MRPTNFLGIGAGVGALLFAVLFLEYHLKLVPCPLCILDRIAVASMVLIFALGLCVERFGLRLLLLGGNSLVLAAGFLFSGRHVWLQNRPFDESSSCLSNVKVAADLNEFIAQAFDAKTDCAMIQWDLFGLSIPDLVLIMFGGFGVLLLAQLYGIIQDHQGR